MIEHGAHAGLLRIWCPGSCNSSAQAWLQDKKWKDNCGKTENKRWEKCWLLQPAAANKQQKYNSKDHASYVVSEPPEKAFTFNRSGLRNVVMHKLALRQISNPSTDNTPASWCCCEYMALQNAPKIHQCSSANSNPE